MDGNRQNSNSLCLVPLAVQFAIIKKFPRDTVNIRGMSQPVREVNYG